MSDEARPAPYQQAAPLDLFGELERSGAATATTAPVAPPVEHGPTAERDEPCGLGEEGITVKSRASQRNPGLERVDALVAPGRERRRRRFERAAELARHEAARASALERAADRERRLADELRDAAARLLRDRPPTKRAERARARDESDRRAAELLSGVELEPTPMLEERPPTRKAERRARKLERRATRHERRAVEVGDLTVAQVWERTAKWYQGRADALERSYLTRAGECELDGVADNVALVCTVDGTVRYVPARCGLHRWCPEKCAKRRRGGWYKRVKRGLAERHREELAIWSRRGRPKGQRPDIELVTPTVRHSEHDDALERFVDDRQCIKRGLDRLRANLWHEDGRALPYVLAWEGTDGTDGRGHVHAHLAVVWPWRDLPRLAATWERVTDGRGLNIDVSGRKKNTRGLSAAASYLASYLGKGGDCFESESGELRAAWHELHADGAHAWSSSKGALAPKERVGSCPDCGAYEDVLNVTPAERRYSCTSSRGPPSSRAPPEATAHATA